MSSISGTQYRRTLLTILVHILQLSALYRNTGLSNCILGMGNLTGYVHVPVKYESFWKRISIKNIDICFVGRYFWHLGETSEFCIVCNEPVLILLVFACKIDQDGLESSRKVGFWINPGSKGQ